MSAANHKEYDYIVIGAGSAGCVMATRLSENPDVNVLLLEAGGTDNHPDVIDPVRWLSILTTSRNWLNHTIPQKHLANRIIQCVTGKMLGGSHSHNACMWMHGHPEDYNHWAAQGNTGWDYKSIQPLLRKIEDYAGSANEHRGKGGPLRVELPKNPHPLANTFIEAACEIGIPYNEDYNNGKMEGVSFCNLTIKDGKRHSVVQGYLNPALQRSNLTVIIDAEVTRLLFDGKNCQGVEYVKEGKKHTVFAANETILSAGTFGSPRLLLLSGVGPKNELQKLGISVIADIPGVGKNLHDHIVVAGISYVPHTYVSPKNNGIEAVLWWKSDANLPTPNIQAHIVEYSLAARPTTTEKLPPTIEKQAALTAYLITPGLVKPASRGYVKLASADPAIPSEISMNYLEQDADMEALLAGVKLCRKIGATKAFTPLRKAELMPGDLDDDKMRDFIRLSSMTFFHPVGSCKMGVDNAAVVDPQLKVHGINKLRIVDASIMPSITTGNTNAPTIMIAEKAAEMIRNEQ